jgi:hypothetical protein
MRKFNLFRGGEGLFDLLRMTRLSTPNKGGEQNRSESRSVINDWRLQSRENLFFIFGMLLGVNINILNEPPF